jgi:hypothetical protein
MPWIKQLDLRLTKGLRLGGTDVTAFADVRNLVNFTTVTSLFAETGDVVNAEHRRLAVEPEVERLENEAGAFLRSTEIGGETFNEIRLPSNCGDWGSTPVNCVLLKRAEARFGDGDGVYTEAEYRTALNASYDLFNGPWTSYAAPRRVRLGFEVRF